MFCTAAADALGKAPAIAKFRPVADATVAVVPPPWIVPKFTVFKPLCSSPSCKYSNGWSSKTLCR